MMSGRIMGYPYQGLWTDVQDSAHYNMDNRVWTARDLPDKSGYDGSASSQWPDELCGGHGRHPDFTTHYADTAYPMGSAPVGDMDTAASGHDLTRYPSWQKEHYANYRGGPYADMAVGIGLSYDNHTNSLRNNPMQLTSGGKPRRRRVTTMAQRRAANIRERRRMFSINEAFDELKTKVPTFSYEKRLSRIETLRLAIMYISFMTDIIKGKDPKDISLPGLLELSGLKALADVKLGSRGSE